MELFKVKLTDPLRGGRMRPQNIYLVIAKSEADARAVLEREQPSAFAYQPTVEVQGCDGWKSHRIITTMVKPGYKPAE